MEERWSRVVATEGRLSGDRCNCERRGRQQDGLSRSDDVGGSGWRRGRRGVEGEEGKERQKREEDERKERQRRGGSQWRRAAHPDRRRVWAMQPGASYGASPSTADRCDC